MCMDKVTKQHVKMMLRRIFTKMNRNRGDAFGIQNTQLVFTIIVVVFSLTSPMIVTPAGNNFDKWMTLNSTKYPGTSPMSDDKWDAASLNDNKRWARTFANKCVSSKLTKVGLIEPEGFTDKHGPAQSIWEEKIQKYLLKNQTDYFKASVQTKEEVFAQQQSNKILESYCFAINVKEWDTANKAFNVSILYNPAFYLLKTNVTAYQEGTYDYDLYDINFNNSFFEILSSVAEQVMDETKETSSSTPKNYQLNWVPTFQGASKTNTMLVVVQLFAGFIFMPLPFTALAFMKIGIETNESNIYSLAKTMGMKNGAYFFTGLIFLTFTSIGLGSIYLTPLAFTIFKQSDKSAIFVALIIYCFGSYFQIAFLLLKFGQLGLIVFVISQLAGFLFQSFYSLQGMLSSSIIAPISVIFPQSGFSNLLKVALIKETDQGGLKWSNIQNEVDKNNCLHLIYGMLGCLVLFLFLIIIMWPRQKQNGSSIVNDQFKEQRNTLLSGNKYVTKNEQEYIDRGDMEVPTIQTYIETDENYLHNALRIVDLKREFKNNDLDTQKEKPTFNAVDGLSLSMFPNQMFVLLGHNGAGKTTTIQMLTGLIPHTSGTASIFQRDVFEDREYMNNVVGICPQHNILIESFTVMENIKYFCGIKMMTDNQIEEFSNDLLEKLTIKDKKDSFVSTLSGGQKRKLQLIIALAGDTKFILLDEPSSGMDPTARKETWDLIKSYKNGRVMILTTHYMDEAEALADRIGIMSKGKLQVCGSALFLKNKYGLGTLLEISLKDKQNPNTDQIDNFITNFCQNVEPSSSNEIIKGEIDESDLYVIKLPTQLKPHFSQLFDKLDQTSTKQSLNIDTYNVRVTSLEEVFNTLGEEENHKQNQALVEANEVNDVNDLLSSGLKINAPSRSQTIGVILKSRFKVIMRKWEWIMGAIYPLGFMFGMIMVSVQLANFKDPLQFNLNQVKDIYNSTNIGFYKYGNQTDFISPSTGTLQPSTFLGSKSFTNQSNFIGVSIANPTGANTLEDLSKFSEDAYSRDLKLQGMIYLPKDDTAAKVFNNEQSLSMFIISNQSSPISQLVLTSLALQALAQQQKGNEELKLNIDFGQLPQNPLNAQGSLPPFIVMTVGTIFMVLVFLKLQPTLRRMIAMRADGVYRQYMLSGVSILDIVAYNFIVDFIQTVIINMGFLALTPMYKLCLDGLWLPLMISCLSIPVYNSYTFVTTEGQPVGQVLGLLVGVNISLSLTFIALIIVYIASAGGWYPAIILEGFMCMINPYFAWGFTLDKLLYRAVYIQNANPPSQFSSDGVFTLNGVLLEVIGLSLCIIIRPLLMMIHIKKGSGVAAQTGNDGTFNQISSKRDKFPGASEQDLDAEFQPLFQDEYVVAEKERVNQIYDNKLDVEALTVKNLKKFFITKPSKKKVEGQEELDEDEVISDKRQTDNLVKAIQGVSFSLKNNECFCLLGVNGAGKSTTFKCMTIEEFVSQGDIKINGQVIQKFYKNPGLLRNQIGYCPQTNPITGELTVKETIELISRIKGVDESQIEEFAQQWAKKFEIFQFFNTYADKLSGGNQRKLCTAQAMLANPSIILLDESSAGVDPLARRRLWKTIRDQSKNSALVITTHSMEEAEALGTKIAIQVDGRFKCFGTAQQIKSLYGQGFTVTMKLDVKNLDDRVDIFANTNIATRDSSVIISMDGGQTQLVDEENQSRNPDNNYMTLDKVRERVTQWFQSEMPDSAKDDDFAGDSSDLIALQFNQELSPSGMLSMQYHQIQERKPIDLQLLFKRIIILNQISTIVTHFEEEFGKTTLTDFTGNQMTIKIDESGEKSIGYLFGFIENMKMNAYKFAINEYQAQDTSLEQIFNQFAKENELSKLNRTLKKQSTSRRGKKAQQ